jgi:hypothetical protein
VVSIPSTRSLVHQTKRMSMLVFSTDGCSFARNFDIFAHKIYTKKFTVETFISGKFRDEKYRSSIGFRQCRPYFVSYIHLFTSENVVYKWCAKVIFLLCTRFNHFQSPRHSPYLLDCNEYPNYERLNCMWGIRNVYKV